MDLNLNNLQRILLIFFAILVLFSGSSHSESWTYLQLFLAATLLFFGLSPATWFHQTSMMQENETSLGSNQENAQCDGENEELSKLPIIGFLTSEKLLLMQSLVKLRSAEIGNIYLQVRQYQKEAKDGNWVPLFMKQMAVSDLHGPYTNVEKDDEEKAEATAMDIFEKRYKFCSIAPTELYEDQIADLQVALLYWRYPPETIINRLQELKAFGFLENWIDDLIKAYQVIECSGFDYIFKEKKRESFLVSLKRISSLWSEVIRILKINILLQQIKNEIPNEQYANENIDLQEISALIELERYLGCAITQENLKEKGFTSLPNKEREEFFLDRLKFNPLWYYYS